MSNSSSDNLSNIFAVGSFLAVSSLNSKTDKLNAAVNTLNNKTDKLTSITKEIGDAQIKLQNAQIDVQQKMLIQMELQNQIRAQELANRERQKELKNVFFAIKTSIETSLGYKDNLTQYIHLILIEKDINNNKLSPGELEELQDKEFANNIIKSLFHEKNNVYNKFTDEEINDYNYLSSFLSQRENIRKGISDTSVSISSLRNEISSAQNKDIKNKMEVSKFKLKYDKWNAKKPMGKSLRISIIVFLVLLIMFHGLGIILLPIFIYLTNNEKRKAVLLKKISSIETYSDNTKINIPDKEEEIINLESKLTLKKQNRDNFEKEVSIFFLKYPNLSFIGR